jgi:hypothetical protein
MLILRMALVIWIETNGTRRIHFITPPAPRFRRRAYFVFEAQSAEAELALLDRRDGVWRVMIARHSETLSPSIGPMRSFTPVICSIRVFRYFEHGLRVLRQFTVGCHPRPRCTPRNRPT